MEICNDLDSDDLEKLKFLFKDVAGLGKLKTATFALELISAIENNRHIELHNGRFLAECFEIMGRSDLVKNLGLNPQQIAHELGQTEFSLNPFRILLYKIAEDLYSDDVEQLKFYSKRKFSFTRKQEECIASAFDLFILLEKGHHIEITNTTPLKDMVKSLENRSDLVDMVEAYQKTYPGTRSTVPDVLDKGQFRKPSLSTTDSPGVAYYEMTKNPRGICVIINNKKFHGMLSREGTDIDEAKLASTFKKLGFIIRPYKDLSVKDMTGVMKDHSIMDHSKYNAFVVCILSHGGENFTYRQDGQNTRGRNVKDHDGGSEAQGNFVYGIDGASVPVRYLTMYFRSSSCTSLANKPKLFFIQACQGKDYQTGLPMTSDLEGDGPSMGGSLDVDVKPTSLHPEEISTDTSPHPSDTRKVIPDESDFLLGYATVFGYVSFRSRSMGSFYISSLTENLDRHADTLDLQTIMVKVNHDVSEKNIPLKVGEVTKKQVPMIQTTLRKQLYFFPDGLK